MKPRETSETRQAYLDTEKDRKTNMDGNMFAKLKSSASLNGVCRCMGKCVGGGEDNIKSRP